MQFLMKLNQMFGQGALRTGAISAIREIHYARNIFNRPEKATTFDKKNNYHKYGLGKNEISKKYTGGWGFFERVDIVSITGQIRDADANNMGSFNFMPWWTIVGHTVTDVIPYFVWGNTNNDTTTFGDRLGATF